MSRMMCAVACFAVIGCGGSQIELREDDEEGAESSPGDDGKPPWLTISLRVTGSEATRDKRQRCLSKARQGGIRIRADAPTRVSLRLADGGNHVSVSGAVTGERDLPGWPMETLCLASFALAADVDHRVRVSKGEPRGCKDVGAASGGGGDYESAVMFLKLDALRHGANFVVLDMGEKGQGYLNIHGRAFACGAEATSEEEEVPAGGCEPSCSPGYACVRGRCVSACNPACPTGQRCGADRLCH